MVNVPKTNDILFVSVVDKKKIISNLPNLVRAFKAAFRLKIKLLMSIVAGLHTICQGSR